jgi:hypothetical protein
MHSKTQFLKCKIVILPKKLLLDLVDSCQKVKHVERVYYAFLYDFNLYLYQPGEPCESWFHILILTRESYIIVIPCLGFCYQRV